MIWMIILQVLQNKKSLFKDKDVPKAELEKSKGKVCRSEEVQFNLGKD